MNKLLIGLLTLSSLSIFANDNCKVALKAVTSNGAYSDSLLKLKHKKKITNILKSKGYEVAGEADGSEDYELSVRANRYYMCGYEASIASFKDSITTSTGYSVDFKVTNGNDIFNKKGNLDKIFLAFPAARTRSALIKAVKEIPTCKNLNK